MNPIYQKHMITKQPPWFQAILQILHQNRYNPQVRSNPNHNSRWARVLNVNGKLHIYDYNDNTATRTP